MLLMRVPITIRRSVWTFAAALLALSVIGAAVVAESGAKSAPSLAPVGVENAVGVEQAPILAAMHVTRTERIDGYLFYVGTIAGRPVVDVFGGEIDESAELAAYLLIAHFRPRAMLFTGTAGAQAPWINVGDVVLSGFVIDKSDIHYRLGGYQTPYKGIEVHARGGADLRGALVAGYDNPLPTPAGAKRFGQGPTTPNRSWVYVSAFAGSRELARLAARTPRLGSTSLTQATGGGSPGAIRNRLLLGVIGQADVWTTPLRWIAAQNSLFETDAEENEGSGFAFASATEGVPWLLIRGISDTPWFPTAYAVVVAADHAARVAVYVVNHLPSRVSTQPVRFADLSPASNARTAGYLIARSAYYRVGPVTRVTYEAQDGVTQTLTGTALARRRREYTYGASRP